MNNKNEIKPLTSIDEIKDNFAVEQNKIFCINPTKQYLEQVEANDDPVDVKKAEDCLEQMNVRYVTKLERRPFKMNDSIELFPLVHSIQQNSRGETYYVHPTTGILFLLNS